MHSINVFRQKIFIPIHAQNMYTDWARNESLKQTCQGSFNHFGNIANSIFQFHQGNFNDQKISTTVMVLHKHFQQVFG